MSEKFKLDDQVTRLTASRIPQDANGVVLGALFEFEGLRLYPVKWFGHPKFIGSGADEINCSLSDCATRDHWHSREEVMTKAKP